MFNTGAKKVKPNGTFYLEVHFKSILIEDLKQVTTFYSGIAYVNKRTEPEQFPHYLDKTQLRLPSVLKSTMLYRQPREEDKGHCFLQEDKW